MEVYTKTNIHLGTFKKFEKENGKTKVWYTGQCGNGYRKYIHYTYMDQCTIK